jgi:antitoxin component of RelBE/YafQ-DinJ toxin-antitoxin module
MGKAIGVKLPHEDVWYAFEQFVLKKWGKKHSMMGLELENAIRLYLQQHAHTDSGKPEDEKPKSRTLKTLKDISEKLEGFKEVTDQDVEDVIVKTVGGDRRTVSKYTHLLKKLGVIEPSRRIPGSNGWTYTVQPGAFNLDYRPL